MSSNLKDCPSKCLWDPTGRFSDHGWACVFFTRYLWCVSITVPPCLSTACLLEQDSRHFPLLSSRISNEHSPKLQIRSHSYLRAVSEVSINRSLDSLDPAGLLTSPKFRSRNESYMRAMSTISQVSPSGEPHKGYWKPRGAWSEEAKGSGKWAGLNAPSVWPQGSWYQQSTSRGLQIVKAHGSPGKFHEQSVGSSIFVIKELIVEAWRIKGQETSLAKPRQCLSIKVLSGSSRERPRHRKWDLIYLPHRVLGEYCVLVMRQKPTYKN